MAAPDLATEVTAARDFPSRRFEPKDRRLLSSVKDYVDAEILKENTIAEMGDAAISSPASGHVLIYDGTNSWDNKAVSGDITLSSAGVAAIASAVVVDADVSATAAIAFSKLAALSSANILVGSAANVATSVAMSGDVAISNTGATTIQAGAVDSAMISNVDSALKCAVATVTSANLVTSGSGVAYVSGGIIPDNAVIVKAWYEVTTTFLGDGNDGSTIAIGSEDQDDDQVIAVAISDVSNPWDAGSFVEMLSSDIDDPTKFVKTTAARQLSVKWTTGGTDTTLSAGALKVFALYVVAG